MTDSAPPEVAVTTPATPRIGELFAGYGGLGHGVQAVYGGTVAWVSDIDKGANKILAHRFPDTPNLGDITTVDWSQVEPVDILTGGSPCQDLSHAGRRAGMTEGTRSNLWVAMREAIAQLRPPMVVWENVRGAYSAAATSELESCAGCVGDGSGLHLRALGRVLGDLSDLGYDMRWHGLRAADVGAPHGRFRVFVVATDAAGGERPDQQGRDDKGRSLVSAGTVAGPGAHAGDPAKGVRVVGRGAGLLPTPRSSDSNGAGAHGQGGVDLRTAVSLPPTPRATDGTKGGPGQRGSSGDLMLPSAVALLPTPTSSDAKASGSAGYGGNEFCTLTDATVRGAGLMPTPTTSPTTGNGHARNLDAEAKRWGGYADAIARWERVIGRPSPDPTIISKRGTAQLSPVFVEWLMGLPAGWITDVPSVTRNEALKALGNGVVGHQAAEALRVMASWSAVAA